MNIQIECSPEQMEVIADHFLENKELGMQPDERHWMLAQARKLYPNCRILAADLIAVQGKWDLKIDPDYKKPE